MTEAYLSAKILEALAATGGDAHDAQKLVLTWAVRDHQLLLGLCKPHLKGLIAARIAQETRHAKKSGAKQADGFSQDDVRAMAQGPAKGDKRHPAKVPPPKSSPRQASVMRQIAAAFRKGDGA